MLQQLGEPGITGEEIHQVHQYLNEQIGLIGPYREFLSTHPAEMLENCQHHHELEIVIEKGKGRSRRKEKRKFPNPVRMAISVLMITLGFAMIVLPAPPYFEMYTIFYFNANDGFTLMDLISLIIVFCGIFTLIMTVQKDKRE